MMNGMGGIFDEEEVTRVGGPWRYAVSFFFFFYGTLGRKKKGGKMEERRFVCCFLAWFLIAAHSLGGWSG